MQTPDEIYHRRLRLSLGDTRWAPARRCSITPFPICSARSATAARRSIFLVALLAAQHRAGHSLHRPAADGRRGRGVGDGAQPAPLRRSSARSSALRNYAGAPHAPGRLSREDVLPECRGAPSRLGLPDGLSDVRDVHRPARRCRRAVNKHWERRPSRAIPPRRRSISSPCSINNARAGIAIAGLCGAELRRGGYRPHPPRACRASPDSAGERRTSAMMRG